MSNERQSIKRKVSTVITVTPMKEKTVEDVWRDFFNGSPPFELVRTCLVVNVHRETESAIDVSETLYRYLIEHGVSQELFSVTEKRILADNGDIERAVKSVVGFGEEPSGIGRTFYCYLSVRYGSNIENMKFEIESYTWGRVTEAGLRDYHKDGVTKLRRALMKLPSVQAATYTCDYREDKIYEDDCKI